MQEKVGFVGLGHMGTPMAWNIHRRGMPLAVYNRSPQRTVTFRQHQVPVYDSPEALARNVDVVVIMVTGPDDLLQVLREERGLVQGLAAGKVVINMSTVSQEATLVAAEVVRASGAEFVDAPVSGTVTPAEEGQLVILAGGEPAVVDRVEPVLLAMGRKVVRCGPAGQGTRMKLVLNLILGNMMQALAEGLLFGRHLELPAAEILEALAGGAMNAPLFQMKGKAIAEGDYAKQFPVHLMFKDQNLLLDAAQKAGLSLPQTATTRDTYAQAMDQGLGDEDMSAVFKVLEGLKG